MDLRTLASGSFGSVTVSVEGKRYDVLHHDAYLVLFSPEERGRSLRGVAIDPSSLWVAPIVKVSLAPDPPVFTWVRNFLRDGAAFLFRTSDGERLQFLYEARFDRLKLALPQAN